MLQSILVYTFLALVMFIFTKYSGRCVGVVSSIFYWLPIFIFSFIFGIRYGVGIDYLNYLEIYENWGVGSYSEDRLEFGIAFVISFCHKLHLNPPCFFGLLAFLQIFFVYLAFRDRKIILAYSILALIFTGVGLFGWNNVQMMGDSHKVRDALKVFCYMDHL